MDISSPWGKGQLHTRLAGRFNAYNLLACLSVLCLLDKPFDDVLNRLSGITCVPGRLESFTGSGKPCVIVDYAHTPDALENVLVSLRDQIDARLTCIFGCGGNRDKTKRPQMGCIAERYADQVIITNDNPRGEDPDQIISDISAGIKNLGKVIIQADRAKAISDAIKSAANSDVILIAGKGHETYQEISGKRYPFSDRQLVRNILEELK